MKRIYFLKAGSFVDKKTGKTVSWKDGYPSDGASGPATDIVSWAWKAHDVLCDRGRWDDGTRCTAKDASRVIKDILLLENRWIRAYSWGFFTWAWTAMKGIGKHPHRRCYPHLAGTMKTVSTAKFNELMGNNLK